MHTLTFHILDIFVTAKIDSDFVAQNLAKDFAIYSTNEDPSGHQPISLTVLLQTPPWDRVPPLDAALHGPGLICYKDKNINYVVYSENGLLIYDFANETGELFGQNETGLYEKAKLTILSRVGELLDRRGIHRVHAFGVSLNDKAVICLLPMEGGKTTTVLNLLKASPEVKVIADDMCFIDRNGRVHPFLLRIGARDQALLKDIPATFVTEMARPYYGIKYFIEPGFFRDRLATARRVTHILVGQRAFRPGTEIKPLSKIKCIRPVIESGVFGLGLPQLLEFFVRGDFRMAFGRLGVILARSVFCLSLVMKTKTFILKLGFDKKTAVEKILEFLQAPE